eukprot:gene8250-74_t
MNNENSYLILGFPLAKFNKESQVTWNPSNKELVEINENNVKITSVFHKNQKPIEHKFKENDNMIKATLSPSKNYLVAAPSTLDCLKFYHFKSEIQFGYKTKDKNTKILGFFWLTDQSIIVITTGSVEIYKLKLTKLIQHKIYPLNINFIVYSNDNRVLLTSQEISNNMIPYKIVDNTLIKLNKLPILDTNIEKKEIKLMSMFNQCYCFHMAHSKQELNIYRLIKDTFIKENSFNLYTMGTLDISVVDSLIFVHNLTTKLTMVYDPLLKFENPLTYPISISPYKPYSQSKEDDEEEKEPESVELYNDYWQFIKPNLVLDKKSGYLFELFVIINELPLKTIKKIKDSELEIIKFLSRRENSKLTLVDAVKQYCVESSLKKLSLIFKLLTRFYYQHLFLQQNEMSNDWNVIQVTPRSKSTDFGISSETITPLPSTNEDDAKPPTGTFIQLKDEFSDEIYTNIILSNGFAWIDQLDFYRNILLHLDKKISQRKLISILIEYIRSLNSFKIKVKDFLQLFLIELLVQSNQLTTLHEYIQYKVLTDSEKVALTILSLEEKYKPAFQMSLDMLSRLGAHQLICDVLLARNKIPHALAVMYNNQLTSISPKIIFENTLNDDFLFFNAFEIFKKLNPKYFSDPECEKYIAIYKEKFE